MKEEKTFAFKEQTGLRISKCDLTTGTVAINGIEITSVEDWEKVMKSISDLQSQLKAKEEAMNKLKEWLDQEYEDCNKIGTPAIGYAMGQIRRVKTKIQELEILSKGENK